ncbi:hypothetical protein NE237_016980 [Protea cynaroides]|uniref:Retrotransposon Copia-like N-terminal domain-containing protein n=1 Tax=Protea cynaroides TaxID=273540 RepID=A0A9Q0K765_9MAGN|nr:hypothetical protein NE237_016980 [Protea cynaroides]
MTSIPSDLNGASPNSVESPEMSTVTNSTPPLVISNIASLIPIKLSSTNYMLWKSLFEPILHGHKLMHLIDGSTPFPITSDSPFYENDQMLLSWINAILSESALPYIVGVSSTKTAWDLLKTRYASATPAHAMSLKRQLSRIKKGSQSMIDYIQQFKIISDQLVACGSTVSEDDPVLYILDVYQLPIGSFPPLFEFELRAQPSHLRSCIPFLFVKNSHLRMNLQMNSPLHMLPIDPIAQILVEEILAVEIPPIEERVIVKAVGGKPNDALQILLIMALHRLPLQILLATLYVINVRYVVELAISPLTATTE